MEPQTLHWAARRYLTARYQELRTEHGRLPNGGREADGYHATTEAKRIFPRYRVVEAMLMEVERLDPDRLPGADVVADALLTAAELAESPFVEPPYDEVEARAAADERRLFADMVRDWAERPDLRADPLPYRRVLTPEESSGWRASLSRRWGVRDFSWHPMLGGAVPGDVLILTPEALSEGDGVDQVRRVLREMGRARVAELREGYGPDYLMDVELLVPRYSYGLEGFWLDEHHDWIAYASHEETVAFGGVLAVRLAATWPEVDSWRWPGWPTLGHQ
ncbi:hypothetical protein [Dactylosporangium sp. NPDC049140]|uniref:hypothetical protein n=1 Tax=Dactylosporangium sp. NPDC049140 TaxID=3155647 RepID=UPI0033E479DC